MLNGLRRDEDKRALANVAIWMTLETPANAAVSLALGKKSVTSEWRVVHCHGIVTEMSTKPVP